MINLKKILKKEDSKRLVSNFISLSILQAVNYILPLVTLPYLIRVIGMDNVGLLAFATATITYFQIVTDYGFNLTATREISIHRKNGRKIDEIFNSVMTIKIGLAIISFFILFIITISLKKFSEHLEIYLLTFGTVIGQVLFPIWFFQGMEKMKYITYLNILAKSIFTFAIFLFVKEREDYYLVPLLTSVGFIVTGILSLCIIHRTFGVRFRRQPINILRHHFLEGWHIFISNLFTTLYRNTNVIILGFLTNNMIVGYYSIAERTIKSLQSIQSVAGNALFPFFTKKFDNSKKEYFGFLKKYSKYVFGVYLGYAVLVYLFSGIIVLLLTQENNVDVLINLKILSLVLLFGGLNYFYGILGLVMLNYKKDFSKSIIITGVCNIVLCYILVKFFKDIGASLALVFSELLLLILIGNKMFGIKKRLFRRHYLKNKA
ncbi:flippase [Sinomicrobium oceani]|uniref:flippase n=1 Tax=Sinomicrobium oceani TaxID=1150368 RepID=UPI00227AEDBE|nr:flippase [Sinomicrobium oceani]